MPSTPLDDIDLALICQLLSTGKWHTVSSLVSNTESHKDLRQSAIEQCRYRLEKLLQIGLVDSRQAHSARKRTEYRIRESEVKSDENATLILSDGSIIGIGNVIIVNGDIYSHYHS